MTAESFADLMASRGGVRNTLPEKHTAHGPDPDRPGWWIVKVQAAGDTRATDDVALPPCFWEEPQPGDFFVKFISGWRVNFHGELGAANTFARKYMHRAEPVVDMIA